MMSGRQAARARTHPHTKQNKMDLTTDNDTMQFRALTIRAINVKFRRRFVVFVVLDALGVLASLGVAWRVSTLFAFWLALVFAVRGGLGATAAVTRVDVRSLYTIVNFHRTSLTRRKAHASQVRVYYAWLVASYVATALLGTLVALEQLALLYLLLTLQWSALARHVAYCVAYGGAAVYFVWSERAAYVYAVTRSVDDVLADPGRMSAFVIASAAYHNRRTDFLMRKKSAVMQQRAAAATRSASYSSALRHV